MQKTTFRHILYEIHLWLGILSGIVLFVVCLSGTISTFREEISIFLQPDKYYVPDSSLEKTRMTADELIGNIEAEHQARVGQIVVPTSANRTWVVRLDSAPAHEGEASENKHEGDGIGRGQGGEGRGLRRGDGSGIGKRDGSGRENAIPVENQPENRAKSRGGKQDGGQGRQKWLKTLYVDPYTGETRAEGDGASEAFFGSMVRLHRFLWLPDAIGRPIVGIATIIFGVLLLTGLVLWLPRTFKSCSQWKTWRIGLRVRIKKGWKLFLYDIHNTLGFYMLLPLLLMTLTGLCWSFGWYRDGASALLGDKVFKQRETRPMKIERPHGYFSESKQISIQAMIDRQNELTSGGGETTVTIPPGHSTAVVVEKLRKGFFTLAARDKTQWDRAEGKPVAEETFREQSSGAKIASLVKPLHLGDFYGTSSKIVYFIACLIATTLPLSGAILWFNKWRLLRKKRQSEPALKKDASQSNT